MRVGVRPAHESERVTEDVVGVQPMEPAKRALVPTAHRVQERALVGWIRASGYGARASPSPGTGTNSGTMTIRLERGVPESVTTPAMKVVVAPRPIASASRPG